MERLDNDFFDETNPRSFINLIPTKLKNLIRVVPDEFWNMTESEIIREIWGKDKKTAPTEWSRTRIAIWKQYDIKVRAQYVSQIKVTDFLKGQMQSIRFYSELESNPAKVRYLAIESTDDWVRAEDILQMSVDEMREIIQMAPAVNARTGVPDYSLLKLKFEIFRYLDERQNGSPTKKIQTESRNVNVNVDAKPSDLSKYKSIAEIDAEIARLERDSKPALVAAKPAVDILLSIPEERLEKVLTKEDLISEKEKT